MRRTNTNTATCSHVERVSYCSYRNSQPGETDSVTGSKFCDGVLETGLAATSSRHAPGCHTLLDGERVRCAGVEGIKLLAFREGVHGDDVQVNVAHHPEDGSTLEPFSKDLDWISESTSGRIRKSRSTSDSNS